MAKTKQDIESPEETGATNITGEGRTPKDSTDATRQKNALEEEGGYIELPDVADIPGQEHITNAGVPREMADTTISSDDEEGIRDGKDILAQDKDDEEEMEIVMGTESDVTAEDLALLGPRDQDMDGGDDESIQAEGLDDTDEDGDPLNEAASDAATPGDDLDVPDANPDDENRDIIGEEDEENDYYSLGDDDEEGTEETP
ncbi:MAG: hypothetical protein ABW019_06595 [Chitinophagaceae bacterium]